MSISSTSLPNCVLIPGTRLLDRNTALFARYFLGDPSPRVWSLFKHDFPDHCGLNQRIPHLPESATTEFETELRTLIDETRFALPSTDALGLLPEYLRSEQAFNIMMGSAAVLSILGLFKPGVTLQGSLQVLPAPMHSIIHGDNPTAPATPSTTSTFQPPIIATPGPPNSIAPALESEDVAFLTEYLQRVINLPVLVTIKGSAPTITKPSVTATLTQAPPVLASPTCHNGGTAFRLEDVEEKISSFCNTASKQSWTATQLPAGATVSAYPNLFSGGQGQYSFDVPASEKEKSLYLEAKFRVDACYPGAAQSVDFRKDKSKWCTDHLLKVLNDCQTVKPDSNTEFWKTGGTRSEDCMQWTIGQSQE